MNALAPAAKGLPIIVPLIGTQAFDLSNKQHLAMRKLMADVYARYFIAVENELYQAANVYRGMAEGLERVAIHVLNDGQLGAVCQSMNNALNANHIMRAFA